VAGEAARIAELLGEGEYFEALGVRPASASLDIDLAAALLEGQHPEQAHRLSAVASVLRSPQRREVYLIAREERDTVLSRVLEPHLRETIPQVRRRVWGEVQRLLRCEFETGSVGVGPRAARSLARRHAWIREAVVNSAFPVVTPTMTERRIGMAYRRVTFLRDCRACGGTEAEGCHCHDEYQFDIPPGACPGTLLRAPGERSGREYYAFLDRSVVTGRPYEAMKVIYTYHRHQALVGAESDLTLEEAQARAHGGHWSLVLGHLALGAALGLLVSSWLAGLATAVPGLLAASIRPSDHYPRSLVRNGVNLLLCLVARMVTGALVGRALAAMLSGLVTGLMLGAGAGLVLLLSGRFLG
jgi:hypothetical protein